MAETKPSIEQRTAAAVTAAISCFLLAFLLFGSREGPVVAALAAVPALPLAFVRPGARLVFFLLGLVLLAGELMLQLGHHNPLFLVSFLGLCTAAGAVAAEAVLRIFKLVAPGWRRRPSGSE